MTSGALPATASAQKTSTRRVVDAPTRMMHWLLAISFLGAYITADGERWRLVHVTLGYTMAGVLVARLLWGLIGSRPARLSVLWRKLTGAPAWLRSALAGRMEWRQGQNLLLAGGVAVLLLAILPLTLSGYAAYQEWGGDWVVEVHDFFSNTMLALVLAHIVLVIGLSFLRQRNLLAPMLTGRTAGPGPDLIKRGFGWVAALVLGLVLGFWGWQWQQAPVAPDAQAQSQVADED